MFRGRLFECRVLWNFYLLLARVFVNYLNYFVLG